METPKEKAIQLVDKFEEHSYLLRIKTKIMKKSNSTESPNLAKRVLADGVLEKAIELLPASTYEPNHIGFFVKKDDEDMGDEDFCENCIDAAVKSAKKHNKEKRLEILDKYKQIEETGLYNGKDCSNYPKDLIASSKKAELKKYPKKSKFTCEGHDPDFGGGESEPKSCADCGHYFYTDFNPDEDCANRLLEYLNDGDLLKDDYKESLKWKLEIAFSNYEYCDNDVKEIIFKCAEIVVKTYSSDTIC